MRSFVCGSQESFRGAASLSDAESYRSVAKRATIEIEIKKSRFLGDVAPVPDEEAALAFLDGIRTQHPTATHHCYAYVTGHPGHVVRMSDDGEPSGTAGRPILEVIEREGLTNTIVVVTRYFGGTLLGAAGLVRAYARAASEGIAAAGAVTYVLHERWRLECEYTHYGRLEYLLRTEQIATAEPIFGAKVTVEIAVPEDRSAALREAIDDLLGGTAEWTPLPTTYLPA